jgi:hypothetical protein
MPRLNSPWNRFCRTLLVLRLQARALLERGADPRCGVDFLKTCYTPPGVYFENEIALKLRWL